MKYIILILALLANGAIADDVVAFGSKENWFNYVLIKESVAK